MQVMLKFINHELVISHCKQTTFLSKWKINKLGRYNTIIKTVKFCILIYIKQIYYCKTENTV